jgi:type VI secretion system secreted protein VgrG
VFPQDLAAAAGDADTGAGTGDVGDPKPSCGGHEVKTITLRLCIRDERRELRTQLPYRLTAGGKVINNHTDDNGMLIEEIDVGVEQGTLEFDRYKIVLQLFPFHSVTEISGVQARLRNLGYYFDPLDGQLSDNTRDAVRHFQQDMGLPVTGDPDAQTQAVLVQWHGA